MNGPACHVLRTRHAVAGIGSERATQKQRVGKFLHRVVVVVTDLGLTIFECTFASSAFTEEQKCIRESRGPEPQIELRRSNRWRWPACW